MKKDIIFFTIVTLLVGWSFFAFSYDLTAMTGRSLFDGWATSLSLSLSITIECSQDNVDVDDNGVLDFSVACVDTNIMNITGLDTAWNGSINLYESSFPTSWDDSTPPTTLVQTAIKYFELNVTGHTEGTYTIFFNLTSAEMGNVAASSVKLFVYNTSWSGLTTTVLDSNSNPRQFSAVTTHFSRFLIGGAAPSSGSSGSVSGGSGSATNPYSSKESRIEEIPEEKSEDAKLPIRPETLIGGAEEVKIEEKEKEGITKGFGLEFDYGIGILLALSLVVLVWLFALRKPYHIEHIKRSNFVKNVNPMVLLFASIIAFTFSASHTGAVIGPISGNLGISMILGVVFLIEAFILFHIRK